MKQYTWETKDAKIVVLVDNSLRNRDLLITFEQNTLEKCLDLSFKI